MLFHRANVELTATITVDNNYIERVTEFKYLGLWLDEKLSFSKHYEHVKSKVAATLGGLNKLIRFLTPSLFKCLINSMIIDYALPIWGSIKPSKLDYLQNKINKLLLHFFYPKTAKISNRNMTLIYDDEIIYNLLENCNVLTVRERFTHSTATFVLLAFLDKYNHINSMREMFTFSRRSRRQILTLPRKNTEIMETNLPYHGAKIWNLLPPHIRDINTSINSFAAAVSKWCMRTRRNLI